MARNSNAVQYLNAAAIQYDEVHGSVPADAWNIERMGWKLASERSF